MLNELVAQHKIKIYKTIGHQKDRLIRVRLRLVSIPPPHTLAYILDYVRQKSPVEPKILVGASAVVLIVLMGIVKYEYVEGKRFPIPDGICSLVREKALDECAIAFEDSYYKGGFSGRDMDWRRIRDGERCQNLGTNIYFACLKNSLDDDDD